MRRCNRLRVPRVLLASIVLGVALAACQTQGNAPRDQTPPPEQMEVVPPPAVVVDTTRVPAPAVVVGCRDDQPRISFAEISWSASRDLSPDSIAVDYTVFKDGFRSEQYATLSDGQEPRAQLVYRPQVPLVALNLQRASRRSTGNTTIVHVERLDAGVNYLWRLRGRTGGQWLAGPSVRVAAPTCVGDEPG